MGGQQSKFENDCQEFKLKVMKLEENLETYMQRLKNAEMSIDWYNIVRQQVPMDSEGYPIKVQNNMYYVSRNSGGFYVFDSLKDGGKGHLIYAQN